MESLTTKEGVSALNLINCAKKNGFDAKGIKIDKINIEHLPCIAHLKINKSLTHFVTVYKMNEESLEIMDPSKGYIKISKKEFYQMFTGTIILLVPKSNIPMKHNTNTIEKKIKYEFGKNKSKFIKICILNIIFILLSLITSLYVKISEYPNYVFIISVIILTINLISIGISYLIDKYIINLGEKINIHLLNDFFEHIFKLPLKYIHLKDPGEIVKRADEMLTQNNVLINSIISFTLNTILIILLFIILLNISLNISLVICLYILTLTLITIILNKKINDKINETINTSIDYNNHLIDYIYGITSIHHANKKEYVIKNLYEYLKSKLEKENKYSIFRNRNESIKRIIGSSFKLIINIYFIYLIANNSFSFEKLIITNFIIDIMIDSLNNLVNLIPDMKYIRRIMIKLNDFYTINVDNKEFKQFPVGDIKIKNLTFSYNSIIPVVNKMNLQIKNREKVIIKGESGCGKSTLCKILNKEYTEYSGTITINNIDIKDIDINSLRNNISYSSQYEKIFIGTIKENILLGSTISDEELDQIINITCLERVIKKRAFGLDTFLYGGGEELSGGERQLILLARALVKKSSILILDETLSEVNEEVENTIINNLFENYQDKTIIYISHKNNKNYFYKTLNV